MSDAERWPVLEVHPVEQVIVLTHDVANAGRPKPCMKIALHATLGYLEGILDGTTHVACRGCRQPVMIEDLTPDQPYSPVYRAPRARVL